MASDDYEEQRKYTDQRTGQIPDLGNSEEPSGGNRLFEYRVEDDVSGTTSAKLFDDNGMLIPPEERLEGED